MSRIAIVCLAWLVSLTVSVPAMTAGGGPQAAARLVTTSWLAEHLNDPDLVVLHAGSARDYATHIPGARLATLADLSTSDAGDGGLTLQMLPAGQLQAKLEALGISDQSRIVVYPASNAVQTSTRVLLTLDYAGLEARAVLLDGGLTAWVAEGRPTSDVAPPARQGRLTPLAVQPLVVDSAFVREHLGTPGFAIVDARTTAFYEGTSTGGNASRPHKTGHIAGAASVPYNELTDGASKYRTIDQLRALFDAAGVKPGDTVVTYCHIGQQATATIFAARLLGHPVRLYDGSFEEWSRLPNAAVAIGKNK